VRRGSGRRSHKNQVTEEVTQAGREQERAENKKETGEKEMKGGSKKLMKHEEQEERKKNDYMKEREEGITLRKKTESKDGYRKGRNKGIKEGRNKREQRRT
jgi:hypothetical protein